MKFEDIQKGDKLKRSFSVASLWYEITGIAHTLDERNSLWLTEEKQAVAIKDEFEVTLELIHRPKKPLPTEIGTTFRATSIKGRECDVIMFVADSGIGPAYYIAAVLVNDARVYEAFHIDEWEMI